MVLLVAVGLFLLWRSSGQTGSSSSHQENATHTTTTSSDHVTELAAGEAKDRYRTLTREG